MSRHERTPAAEVELLQGTLDMLILKVVALSPIHGYGIVQRILQISKDALQIRQGSLYPALYRLENRGLAQARMESHGGWARSEVLQLDQGRPAAA
jgi:DNA-binding PadR family transcriptional regulator